MRGVSRGRQRKTNRFRQQHQIIRQILLLLLLIHYHHHHQQQHHHHHHQGIIEATTSWKQVSTGLLRALAFFSGLSAGRLRDLSPNESFSWSRFNALTMLFTCINDLICQVALGWAASLATLQVQIARPPPKHQWIAPYFPQEGTGRPLEAISRHEHPHDSETGTLTWCI